MTLLEKFQYESTIQVVNCNTGQAHSNTMDAATIITLSSHSPAPKPSVSCPVPLQPRGNGHQKEGPLPKLLERQSADFYPELSLPVREQCPQCLRSLAPTASTAILLWYSLLPPLHRRVPASRFFFCSLHTGFFFICLTERFQRHKQGYKTILGLFYRKENRGTLRAGV